MCQAEAAHPYLDWFTCEPKHDVRQRLEIIDERACNNAQSTKEARAAPFESVHVNEGRDFLSVRRRWTR